MSKFGVVAGILCMLPGLASAGILFTVPDVSVLNTSGSTSLTVTVTIDTSTVVTGYDLSLVLAPQAGATGTVALGTTSQAGTNYILTGSHSFDLGVVTDPNTAVFVNSGLLSGSEAVSGTKNLITLNLVIGATALGNWDLKLVQENPVTHEIITGLIDGSYDKYTGESYDDGVITVTPEPATVGLLVLGGLALIRRRGRA